MEARGTRLDLAVIGQVLDREVSVFEAAAAHADALEVQIRTLRLRSAVLRAVAERGSGPEEMDLMRKLARLSGDERRRLIPGFVDDTSGGLGANAGFVDTRRSAVPELPDDPDPGQADAWVELTEALRDSVVGALDAGIDAPTARYAQTAGRADDADLRHWLLIRLEAAGAPAMDGPSGPAPVFTWFGQALRTRTACGRPLARSSVRT
ncbi:hypothetical protein [Streptomyces sp. AC512_CC834]|uniref:hypothetical protein n=1 Tax=Streptomyces sp. AC512_CC834 TaxID=2823691 RepID=UPI001C26F43E|nr:hypothetical protein [Streptomyces sp. AC512_CC834]